MFSHVWDSFFVGIFLLRPGKQKRRVLGRRRRRERV